MHLNDKRNWIVEYEKIKSCISKLWKQILKGKEVQQNSSTLENPKPVIISSNVIIINNKLIDLKNESKNNCFLLVYTSSPNHLVLMHGAKFSKRRWCQLRNVHTISTSGLQQEKSQLSLESIAINKKI